MLIRAILAIPLAVVVIVFGIGAFVVAIIGWFGALFTGRMPTFARTFILRYVKLFVNLLTYLHFLTDKFPPFEPDDAGYVVHMAVPPATTLNRWSVFFRLVLLVPAAILVTVVSYGVGLFIFFLWLITLVSGWLPLSAHNALAAFIRYQARYTAFYLLCVPTYPGRLFGDGDMIVDDLSYQNPPVAPGGTWAATPAVAPPPMAQPPTAPPPIAAPPMAPPPMPPPPMAGAAMAPPPYVAAVPPASGPAPGEPRLDPWRLILNRGAIVLLTVFIVVGALGYIGQIVLQATLTHRTNQINTLNASVETLTADFRSYGTTVQSCPRDSTQVSCVEEAASSLATQLRNFANEVSGLTVDGVSSSAIAAAVSSARLNADNFDRLANAGPTATDYEQVVQSLNLDNSVNQLQNDLNAI